ncbi:4Fe-4S binding protein [archaeon]|nr:4Fe-4S binding protein [archaeon]
MLPSLGRELAPEAIPHAAFSQPVKGVGGKTGLWRFQKPTVDRNKCIRCGLCWVFCPDIAISFNEEGYPIIDYDYCKGCGICANECPRNAISMVREE